MMSQTILVFDLVLKDKNLKLLNSKQLTKNLKLIDIQNNYIEELPNEICEL